MAETTGRRSPPVDSERAKGTRVTEKDNGIGGYLEEFVFCKYREELSAMIAELPTNNGEEPPKRLAIKAGHSVIFDSWESCRQTGPKRNYGTARIAEALVAGPSERSKGCGYVPAKTPEQRREDNKAVKLEKEADELWKRTPKGSERRKFKSYQL